MPRHPSLGETVIHWLALPSVRISKADTRSFAAPLTSLGETRLQYVGPAQLAHRTDVSGELTCLVQRDLPPGVPESQQKS